jgi:hypothetical protein
MMYLGLVSLASAASSAAACLFSLVSLAHAATEIFLSSSGR